MGESWRNPIRRPFLSLIAFIVTKPQDNCVFPSIRIPVLPTHRLRPKMAPRLVSCLFCAVLFGPCGDFPSEPRRNFSPPFRHICFGYGVTFFFQDFGLRKFPCADSPDQDGTMDSQEIVLTRFYRDKARWTLCDS